MARVKLEADSRQIRTADRDLERLTRTGTRTEAGAKRLTSAYRALGGVLAALGAARAFRAILSATIEQERATVQMEQALRSTGRYTPELSRAFQDYASELQKVTSFGDEAIISAQGLLLTFTRVGGDVMPRATEAILDVAQAMGTDLRTATMQVGRALNDPIQGMTALSRSGIQFTQQQRDLVRELVETNRVAEAQGIILAELETQFGGSARAARNTLGGAISGLKNAFGDLLEGDAAGGGVKGATAAINSLTETLNDPLVVEGFQNLITGGLGVLETLAKLTAKVNTFSSIMARGITGAAKDEMELMERQIKRTSGALDFLEQELSVPRFRRVNIFVSTEELERRRVELALQLQEEEAVLETLFQRWLNLGNGINDSTTSAADGLKSLTAATSENVGLSDNQLKVFEEITQSLEDQIFALNNNNTAYEMLIATRRIGVEQGSEEANQILALINQRNELTESIENQTEALEAYTRMAEEMERQQFRNLEAEERLRIQFDQRLDIIQEALEQEQITQEQARQAQLTALQMFEDEKERIEKEALEARQRARMMELAAASQLFGDLLGLANQFGDESNAINQALFIAQKGFSIAQAVMAIQTAIANAAGSSPFPFNLGAMATVAASTAGIVSTIQSVQPRRNGGFATGNVLVGEQGPELIRMPQGGGRVTPFNDLMREAQGGNTNNSTNNVSVSFTVNAMDTVGFEDWIQNNRDTITNAVSQALRTEGRML